MTTVAAAQLRLEVGDIAGNRAAALDAIAAAAKAGATLVVLPELCDTGYVFKDRAEAARLADAEATLAGWTAAATATGVVVVGGYCDLVGDEVYNSAAIVDASGVRARYRKAHLWDEENGIFTPGDTAPPVVQTAAGRLAVMVCYDLEFPEWVRLPALAGAEIIAAPVNWPHYEWPAGERPAEVVKAQAAAATNGVCVVVADRCGREREVSWIGGSIIIDQAGYPLAGPVLADRAALLIADIDLVRSRDKRINRNNDLLSDRRPTLYR